LKRKFNIKLFFGLLLITSTAGKAQQHNLPLSRDAAYSVDRFFLENDSNIHTGVRPYRMAEVMQHGYIFPEDSNVFKLYNGAHDVPEKNLRLVATPLLNLGFGADLSDETGEKTFPVLGAGFSLSAHLTKKLSFYGEFFSENSRYTDYITNYITNWDVVPSMGVASGTKMGYSYSQFSGHLSYSPNEIFNLQAGSGRNFFGEGYRSLLLSDNAYNYPFLKVTTNVWNIKYVNLFTALKHINAADGNRSEYINKFATFHYLSWNISRKVNVSLFESVIWQGEDTLLDRGFDVNYLNPVIFYRPIEFATGSADNALVGLNTSVKIGKKNNFYGQLILDEFLLKELLSDSGWWANKYGIQLGVKSMDIFKIENLDVQAEFNLVRPFTYAHLSPKQNLGHFNQNMAHPLGANFYEAVTIVRYRKGNWSFENQFNFGVYGTDTSAVSYGGDIFQSYSSRGSNYGHKIGQGLKNTLIYNHLRVAYVLSENLNLRIEGGHVFRSNSTDFGDQMTNYFYLGVKTSLWNQYTDF
jgi:hypothetical protein